MTQSKETGQKWDTSKKANTYGKALLDSPQGCWEKGQSSDEVDTEPLGWHGFSYVQCRASTSFHSQNLYQYGHRRRPGRWWRRLYTSLLYHVFLTVWNYGTVMLCWIGLTGSTLVPHCFVVCIYGFNRAIFSRLSSQNNNSLSILLITLPHKTP